MHRWEAISNLACLKIFLFGLHTQLTSWADNRVISSNSFPLWTLEAPFHCLLTNPHPPTHWLKAGFLLLCPYIPFLHHFSGIFWNFVFIMCVWKMYDDVISCNLARQWKAFSVKRHFLSSALGNFILLFLWSFASFHICVLSSGTPIYLARCSNTGTSGVILYFSYLFSYFLSVSSYILE